MIIKLAAIILATLTFSNTAIAHSGGQTQMAAMLARNHIIVTDFLLNRQQHPLGDTTIFTAKTSKCTWFVISTHRRVSHNRFCCIFLQPRQIKNNDRHPE